MKTTRNPTVDKEGFLKCLADWNEDVAQLLADQNSIILSEDHWEIIYLVRNFYKNYNIAPANRVLVNLVKIAYGPAKGSSIHLMQLFSGKPAKVLSKIAGLPKPNNCD